MNKNLNDIVFDLEIKQWENFTLNDRYYACLEVIQMPDQLIKIYIFSPLGEMRRFSFLLQGYEVNCTRNEYVVDVNRCPNMSLKGYRVGCVISLLR